MMNSSYAGSRVARLIARESLEGYLARVDGRTRRRTFPWALGVEPRPPVDRPGYECSHALVVAASDIEAARAFCRLHDWRWVGVPLVVRAAASEGVAA